MSACPTNGDAYRFAYVSGSLAITHVVADAGGFFVSIARLATGTSFGNAGSYFFVRAWGVGVGGVSLMRVWQPLASSRWGALGLGLGLTPRKSKTKAGIPWLAPLAGCHHWLLGCH